MVTSSCYRMHAGLASRTVQRAVVTVDDPKVFTRSWTMRMPLYRRQEKPIRILEYPCYENLTLDKFHPDRRR